MTQNETKTGKNGWICRHCFQFGSVSSNMALRRCPKCSDARILIHPEILNLSIAHVDCDAFFAAVEKRDRPELAEKPVIVGGGRRGVVTAACYIARTYGVRSAMPMFKALKLCPDAVVIAPGRGKYSEASRLVRDEMERLTPLVQPLSIDEAFLDLTGTEKLHKAPPAIALARLAGRIEEKIGITVSIGLSHNKFLAKLASDLDKPRGFAVIGKAETKSRLAEMSVRAVWGVGPRFGEQLTNDGFARIADIQKVDIKDMASRYGENGLRLWQLAHGIDARPVRTDSAAKSVSAETTFRQDIKDREELEQILWELSEKVSRRMKLKNITGRVVTLTLKTASFKRLSKRLTLSEPSNMAHRLFETGSALLREVIPQAQSVTAYRLIGIGYGELAEAHSDPQGALFASPDDRLDRREEALDLLREKFGPDAIGTGRNFDKKKSRKKPTHRKANRKNPQP